MKKIILGIVLTAGFASGAENPLEAVTKGNMTKSVVFSAEKENLMKYKIAVIDNGVDTECKELQEYLLDGYNGRDKNTNIKASTVQETKSSEYSQIASHGTHVAGIIVKMGASPTIYKANCKSDDCISKKSTQKCLEHISTRKDISIVSMSFALDFNHQIKAIKNLAKQGKIIVIAAGNENKILEDTIIKHKTKKNEKLSQILEQFKGQIILVGATERVEGIEKRTVFSNKPSENLKPFFISAPGSNIKSYVPSDRSTPEEAYSGTSMAAPIVAGTIMFLAKEFDIAPSIVVNTLFFTATKTSTSTVNVTDTGCVMDFYAARDALKARTTNDPYKVLTKKPKIQDLG